jgi:hypothetical protein
MASTSALSFLRRHQRVQVADVQQLVGSHRLGAQEQPFGRCQPQPRDIPLQAAGVVVQPQPRRRHAQCHALHADTKVAGQRQVGGATEHAAVQPRDGWQRQGFQRVDGVLEEPRVVAGRSLRLVEFAEMKAGTEGAPAAGEHEHTHGGFGGDGRQVILQRQQVLAVQPVQVLRPLQRDRRAAARSPLQQRRAGRRLHRGVSGR